MYSIFQSPTTGETNMQELTTIAQDRGNATIPLEVRRRLGITKGTTIKFVIHDNGFIEIKATPKEKIDTALKLFDELGTLLQEDGITLEQWMQESKTNRKALMQKHYPTS